ncbi:MAG: helix-turn-helix domain-containing protein [Acutalibacteraceae bacterium]
MTNNPEMQIRDFGSVLQREFPSDDEIKAAQRVCCGRCCNQCESPAEYAWRKREVDLSFLLEMAIKTELTDFERDVITGYWFDSKSISQLAKSRGCNISLISKTLKNGEERLERVLRYVVMYQENLSEESAIPLILGRARVISAARNAEGGSSGERIKRLRQSQSIKPKKLARVLGIKTDRLRMLENGAEPSIAELMSLSAFYKVTTDYILKGERRNDENAA